jgi:hypothetical protein
MTVHALTIPEATEICDDLAAQHIHINCCLHDGNIHLTPTEPVTTAEEVTALRAFSAKTDQRMLWHPRSEVAG